MRYCLILVFAATGLISSGCAGRARYYDPYYRDYHTWHRDDDLRYRRYRQERREPYRNFRRLNRHDQEEYWRWRHDHDRH